jgi:quercetin dioxygenase-like cupin family protein
MALRNAVTVAWALIALGPVRSPAQSTTSKGDHDVKSGIRLLLENEHLRAHLVVLEGGGTLDLSGVKPNLIVLLTRGASASLGGGKAPAVVGKDHPVAWSDAPYGTLRSTGGGPAEILAVELRRDAPRRKGPAAEDHATRVAPEIYRLTFENDRLRVIDVHILPGQGSSMHTHDGLDFRYPLTSATLKLVEADGATRKVDLRAGIPRWEEPPSRHTMENAGSTELRLVLIELK